MKKKIQGILLASVVCGELLVTLGATFEQAQINEIVKAIRNRHTLRYAVYDEGKITEELTKFMEKNQFTEDQLMGLHRSRMESAAQLQEMAAYEESLAAIRACTNENLRIRTLQGVISAFNHLYAGAKKWKLGQAIYEQNPTIFSVEQRMRMISEFAGNETRLCDFDAYKVRVEQLVAFRNQREEVSEREKANFDRTLAQTVTAALAMGAANWREYTERVFAENKEIFSHDQQDAFTKSVAQSYIDQKDRKGFDAVLAKVVSLPIERRFKIHKTLLEMLFKFDPETAREELDKALADKSLTPIQRTQYLSAVRDIETPPIFNYGFNEPGQYGRYREVLCEQLAIQEANPEVAACDIIRAGWLPGAISRIVWFDDLGFAEQLLERRLAVLPNDAVSYQLRAQIRAIRGDVEGAVADFNTYMGKARAKAEVTNEFRRVEAFLRGRGIRGFDQVNKALALSDADRLAALRKTSRTLFQYRRYDDCQEIFREIVGKMYSPVVEKVHQASFVADAPKTAEGFVRSEYYNDLEKMETTFYPYGDNYGENPSIDVKRHLRGAEPMTCDPAWRTGLRVICDADAVHVFIRCDDPGIEDVKLGKRTAGGLEMFLLPGTLEDPYHSIFFSGLPGTDNPHDCEWAMPGRHYRRNVDSFTKDATLTPEGVVAHISIPWISFYDFLPVDGRTWKIGCLRECPSGLQTVGGIVHELSRGLTIQFPFGKKEVAELKRRIAIQAYNRYRAIRENKGKFIQTWADSLLGDPEFYAASVAPLLGRLDEAGADLLSEKPKAKIESVFAEIVPLWAEINYEIAERRTRWLDAKLFEE